MWTTEQALALAPDAGSASAGKGLAAPHKWAELGAAAEAGVIWGLCKGSGMEPYKTRISLGEPAFKCSCPSRKFPCKHSLGLLLLHASKPDEFKPKEAPAWVSEWLASREDRAAKKAVKAQSDRDKPPDPEAQAKRAAQREGNVAEGIELLDRWLNDLIRRGLAHAQSQPSSFWHTIAARMVDSQAPGLARRVREMAAIPHSGDGWPERLLRRAASLHLLIEAWRRLDRLDPAVREDARAAIGFTQGREEALEPPGVEDVWRVVALQIEDEPEGLRTRRIWLSGEGSGRTALILSFTHRSAPVFEVSPPFGARIEAEVAFYPLATPQRALLKRSKIVEGAGREVLPNAGGIDDLLDGYATALGSNPWIEYFPAALDAVTPEFVAGRWNLRDGAGRLLPMRAGGETGWRMTALCGGHPSQVFGEWNGESFTPLSVAVNGAILNLAG